jgi:hypothetical protein
MRQRLYKGGRVVLLQKRQRCCIHMFMLAVECKELLGELYRRLSWKGGELGKQNVKRHARSSEARVVVTGCTGAGFS